MKIISGRDKSDQIAFNLSKIIKDLGIKPRLDIFLIGNDFASNIYVNNKVKKGEDLGIEVVINRFDDQISQVDLEKEIIRASQDSKINGIILQMPIPDHLDYFKLVSFIDPGKDVDGLHQVNVGRLCSANYRFLVPCTAHGCLLLVKNFFLEHCGSDDLSGKKAVVVGRSNIVGKPSMQLLLSENCTVTIAHSRTKDIESEVSNTEILISAIGKFDVIKPSYINSNAVVIDVGINRYNNSAVGDINFNLLDCFAATPVPGGVGLMTVIMLMFNVIQSMVIDKGLLTISSELQVELK